MNLVSCKQNNSEKDLSTRESKIEVQGHRGTRGTMPENTISGFIQAIKDSANVMEMDLVISADRKVVVSHEPYMSSDYVLTPSMESIQPEEEQNYNLFTMDYDSIKKFEVGLKPNPNFPRQKKISAYKPLLSDVIDSIENFTRQNKIRPVKYNVELKSSEAQYGTYQPFPAEFADLVMNTINGKNIGDRYNIQSFDKNILEVFHGKYPKIPLAYLIEKPGIENNLNELSFVPEIYSPNYKLVNKAFADSIKARKMQLIPWTVNDSLEIQKMIELNVDGIISDFPYLVNRLLKQ